MAKPGKTVGKAVEALAVFYAHVRALSGQGNVVAVVRMEDGGCHLLGSTNLAKVGLLPMSYYGKYVRADRLGALLGKPVIVGGSACKEWLEKNSIKGILTADILSDAVGTPAAL